MAEGRFAEFQRRIDDIVKVVATDQAWGKLLYRQFEKHCADDDRRHVENVTEFRSQREEFRQALDAQAETFREALATQQAAFTSAMDKRDAALKEFTEAVNPMMPALRRAVKRDRRRRMIVRHVKRSHAFVMAVAVGLAGLFAWWDGMEKNVLRALVLIRKLWSG